MTRILSVAGSALALAAFAAPAEAQMNMPGMHMPTAAKNKPAARSANRKAAEKKRPAKKETVRHRSGVHAKYMAKTKPARPGTAMSMSMPMHQSQGQLGMMQMPMPGAHPDESMPMPMPPHPAPGDRMQMPMDRQPDSPPMVGMQHGEHGGPGTAMSMSGALGPYATQRESSGTAWQPDSSTPMGGAMTAAGEWMAMAHGTVNLVYDHQSGPRGDDKTFVSGMVMGMARRPLGDGTLQFRAMLSPDPLMGPRGYPLLLATGETANGRTPLVDRQHPHDLFMELSGSVSQTIGPKSSVFLYAGLPGEPAFGPPAFMHRESIMDSPEAPISHHWLDSTHISFGVVTAGLVFDQIKIEASRFNAREPDQHRWDIETGPLESTAIRVSWNPTRTVALQGSWGRFMHPEQLEPGVNQTRWSASALWAEDLAPGWHAAATLAWGRKSAQGHNDDAYAAEASLKHSGWTVFARGESVRNRELLGPDGPAYRVGKVSLGTVRDVQVRDHLSLGAGGLFAVNFLPAAIAPVYGKSNPTGLMGFVRLKLD